LNLGFRFLFFLINRLIDDNLCVPR
jgi:hypothetical protein